MFVLDAEVKEIVESGVAIIVAASDSSGRPQVRYGWAARVHAGGSAIDVFLDAPRSGPLLDNLAQTGRIAMTVGDPISYRSLQFKGSFTGSGAATQEDREWVQRGHEAFLISTALVGDPPEAIRNLWMDDVIRITFSVESAFDQTPGPEAGRQL